MAIEIINGEIVTNYLYHRSLDITLSFYEILRDAIKHRSCQIL